MTKWRKILLTAALLILSAIGAAAQDIGRFRSELSIPGAGFSTVTVTEHGTARDAVAAFDAKPKPQSITGYRVRIFFDNSQNAREQAQAAQARFHQLFSGIPTYFVYDTPSFMVTVGNAITMEEVIVLWNRVKGHFPTAFIWRGEIPLQELLYYNNTTAAIPQEEANRVDRFDFQESLQY